MIFDILRTMAELLLVATIIYLTKKMMRTGALMRAHLAHSRFKLEWEWTGGPADVYNIVVVSHETGPFSALIGREIKIPGFKPGIIWRDQCESTPHGELTVRRWLGKSPCKLVFVINKHVLVPNNGQMTPVFSVHIAPDHLHPDVIHRPHWWERHLGF